MSILPSTAMSRDDVATPQHLSTNDNANNNNLLPHYNTQSRPRDPTKLSFLSLPPELRNEIYTLALTSPDVPAVRCLSARNMGSDAFLPPLNLRPALLATCRQIYVEALGFLYACNTFAAHPRLLAQMPYLVSPRRPVLSGPGLSLIRNWYIRVRLDVDPGFDAAAVEKAFSGAEELEVDVFQAMYGGCDFAALGLFEGVRGVGTAVVNGSTGGEYYYNWLQSTMMKRKDEAVSPFGAEWEGQSRHWEPWVHGNR